MKNQYFGDINDYRKYGILRELVQDDLHLVMCWMLTQDDGRTDGKFIDYLEQPKRFRHHDEALFDVLRSILEAGTRDVLAFEWNRIIPHAKYVRSLLDDSVPSRRAWQEELEIAAADADLVFFDPDNGVEVRSVRKGRRDSRKFVYWDELKAVWDSGASIMVYQHFPRIRRGDFLQTMGIAFREKIGAEDVLALVTSNVAFFLAAQPEHKVSLWQRSSQLQTKWHGQVTATGLLSGIPEERRIST